MSLAGRSVPLSSQKKCCTSSETSCISDVCMFAYTISALEAAREVVKACEIPGEDYRLHEEMESAVRSINRIVDGIVFETGRRALQRCMEQGRSYV